VLGTLSPEMKWLECEADPSHPSSAEVKNAWSYTFTPPYIFMPLCLVKHRDNFTLLFVFIVFSVSGFVAR
jgi:hypothetical protein